MSQNVYTSSAQSATELVRSLIMSCVFIIFLALVQDALHNSGVLNMWDDGNDYTNSGDKMNRKDWEFEYTAKELADAAALKRDYRQSRVEWWEKQKEEVMKEVKESGLEVSESLANGYTSNVGRGPQVMVRSDLQTKLMECHERIQKHAGAVREYDGWTQVLEAQLPTNKLKLKHADWLFFFGKN